MIGVIVSLVVSIGLVLLLIPVGNRYLKANGYHFSETDNKKTSGEGSSALTGHVLPQAKPESDSAMTDAERADELRMLQQAWNTDHIK